MALVSGSVSATVSGTGAVTLVGGDMALAWAQGIAPGLSQAEILDLQSALSPTAFTAAIAATYTDLANKLAYIAAYINANVSAGSTTATQPNNTIWFNGCGNPTTTPNDSHAGFGGISSGGVSSILSPSSGSRLNAARRVHCTASAASHIGIWEGSSHAYLWRGDAAGRGGFNFKTRFSLTGIAASCSVWFQVGVSNDSAPIGFTDLTLAASTASQRVMLCSSFTTSATSTMPTTNWKISESNGSTNTVHDSGMAITVNDFIEFVINCAPNDTKMTWTINNLTQGTTATGTVSTTLPGTTTFMIPFVEVSVGTPAVGTNAVDVASIYIELLGSEYV